MKNYKTFFGFYLFGIFLIYIFINIFVQSRREYSNKYNFIITKIDVNAKGDFTFYDSLNNEYFFLSYRFNRFQKLGISVGDKVFKKSYSRNLTISRKIDDEYKVYHVQEPNGRFPFWFYCYDCKVQD